jgi:ubiquinone biosynthesis O-methyltransferase
MTFLVILLYRCYSILAQLFSFLSSSPIGLARSTAVSTGNPPGPSASPGTSSSLSESFPHYTHATVAGFVSAQSHSGWNGKGAAGGSLDEDEVAKFGATSAGWWDVDGEFCLLHRMNPVRVLWIRQRVLEQIRSTSVSKLSSLKPFTSLSFLDVGSGGGLLSESLAKLGGKVLGIDAALPNIVVARAHASKQVALSDLSYRHSTAEQLKSSSSAFFDVVCALEVVEHVLQPHLFTTTLCQLVCPGGLLFMSTINRTNLAWLLTIIGAEYVMGWASKGTHDWNKYVNVQELQAWVETSEDQDGEKLGMQVVDVCGLLYDPWGKQWSLDEARTEVNYIVCARRPLR